MDNAPLQVSDRFVLATANTCIVDDVNIGHFKVEFSYDALGRRIERRVENGGTQSKTRFIHDGARVAEEWDIPTTGSPTLEASYVYGNYLDEVLTMRRGGVDYYHHGDDMHNVVKLTDGDGLVVEGYDYGDYGAPEFYDENGARASATASAFGNPYLFSGREWEEELGLYHFRNRYMDPALGRFTSRDPLGIWGDGVNLGNGYTYCASNPWSLVDPFGLSPNKPGGNAIDHYRQQQAETEASRRSETIWAGITGFFDFGKEDALLATEGISYIPFVGWGADSVLLSEAIARGDAFDSIMAGIGFIPGLGDAVKAIVDTGGRAIRGIKGLRGGARVVDGGERAIGGLRSPALRQLNDAEISQITREFEEIGGDPSMLRFNEGRRTSFVTDENTIRVRADVFPSSHATSARSQMSSRAVLAHELHGHAAFPNTRLAPGSWNDEFRASYRAARRAPGLSAVERRHLMLDAVSRAQDAGVSINYNTYIRAAINGEL